jgi:nicotinate-nucleotide adenylyltransferase
MDSLLSFKSWYRWQTILERCHLVVSCRPGWHLDENADIHDLLTERQTKDPQKLHQALAGHIYLAEIDEQDVSSTQIRQCFADNKSTDGLLPSAVAEYIKQYGLYTEMA